MSATNSENQLPRKQLLDRLSALSNMVGAAALVGVVVVQSWQVFARYVLNASPAWTESVATLLLSTAMSLGAATMVHRQAHFSFSLLRDGAPPLIRKALIVLVDVAIITVGLAFSGFGAFLLVDGWDVPLAGVDLPQGVPFLPITVGGLLMAIFSIDRLRRRLTSGNDAWQT